MSPINSLSSNYLQSILSNALEGAGSTANQNGNLNVSGSLLTQGSDSGQLSPFAQLMSTLQQLQQSNPTEYEQVTSQIATNLSNAAQTAQSDGNTTAANQLTQLANDFTSASQSGQLPNIQDLAQAVGGHHHHHHGSGQWSSNSDTANTTTSDSSTSQSLSQLFGTSNSQTDTLNPLSIIWNTLNTAGVTNSGS